MKIKIGERLFATKKELIGYTKCILDKNKNKPPSPAASKFLLNLFQRHPNHSEKIGCGIRNIVIGDHPNGNGCHITLYRNDWTCTDISWRMCIDGKYKSYSYQLRDIMRNAIMADIEEFRVDSPNKCEACGGDGPHEIDHVLPFKDLSEVFMEEHTEFGGFDGCDADDIDTFRKKYENKWRRFHKKNAIYQKLCVACHRAKTVEEARRRSTSQFSS